MSNQYSLSDFIKEAGVLNASEIADYFEKYGKLPPNSYAREYFAENGRIPSQYEVHDVKYDRGPTGLVPLANAYSYKDNPVSKKKLLSKRNVGIGAAGLTAATGGAYLLKKRRDRKKAQEEKIAGLNQAAVLARGVGGKALKAVNPVSTAVGVVSSAKNSAMRDTEKQNRADNAMGVSGRFSKVAATDKDQIEDKRYGRLYKKKKKGLTSNQRAVIASGATLGLLGLYGSAKHKDPLYVPKVINRNKGFLGAKAVGAAIKQTPFKDVAREASRAMRDANKTNQQVDLEDLGNSVDIDDVIAGGAGNSPYSHQVVKVIGLGMAGAAGKKMGDALYENLTEKVKAKKLAREKEEQERADAYSKNLRAADLFKKASIATGDDIVTAVNKSVEKFLPEEIKKREERRNRYNSTVNYVDHGAHGGDAPQRRNK